MDEKHTPSWKTILVIDIVGFIWLFIEMHFDSLFLSLSTLGVMGAFFVGSVIYTVKDWKAGFKKSALLCIVGIIIQLSLVIFYCIASVKSLINLFN